MAMGGLSGENTEAVRDYFGALRPWFAVLVLLAYAAPLLAAIAYRRTMSDRESMLFWLGSGSYARFGLICVAMVWFAHASVFAITRFERLRTLVLYEGADHAAFDRRSRESFLITNALLGLYLVVLFYL